MRIKKIISILMAVLLVASAGAVTVMSYSKSYKSGYSYNAKESAAEYYEKNLKSY